MKKKILSLIALGLICIPFTCNAETWDNTTIGYSEKYFGLNDSNYSSETILNNKKEYNLLTYEYNRTDDTGSIYLKKDATLGGFDILVKSLTYVANGDNVVSELPAYSSYVESFTMTGEGSITVYGLYLSGLNKVSSETIKTAYYGDTCVKESNGNCYYFKTNDDFTSKFASLKELSVNQSISSLTSDDFVSGKNNASIKEDKDHVWITKDWINEKIKTDMTITYNENGSVTFSSKKESNSEDKVYSLKSNLNVVFTSKSELNKNYVLKTTGIKVADLKVDDYNPISGYDINVYNGSEIVPMQNGEYEITIPVAVKYDSYIVAYVKDGKIVETIPATYKDGFVTFKTTHLSEYAVFGKNNAETPNSEETEKNPQTSDNILVILMGLLLSGSALIITSVKKLKRN